MKSLNRYYKDQKIIVIEFYKKFKQVIRRPKNCYDDIHYLVEICFGVQDSRSIV